MLINKRALLICAGWLLGSAIPGAALQEYCTDVCVYGGTSGGVIAAVQAARMGKTVTLVVVNNHLGGMTSGGLGETDVGSYGTGYIQGVALEFYTRVGQQYGTGAKFTFEPHVAEIVFNTMAAQAGVMVCTNQYLSSVLMQNQRIVALTMNNGNIFRASAFIDASYEGDLMAGAGVNYTLGREATTQYGESYNGIRPPNDTQTGGNQFGSVYVNPYLVTNDSSSGLLPLIQAGSPGTPGAADQRIEAYNFRMCLTQIATNLMPFTAPPGYDASQYQLLARYIQALKAQGTTPSLGNLIGISTMPNNKTDINNNGPVSTDFIGQASAYPETNYAGRALIWQAHKNYTQGLFYFLANDPSVPATLQSQAQSYGLCKDEFMDNGGWPYALYVREARRMISDYVMTQSNCLGQTVAPDAVGLADYNMDSHNCQRVVVNGYAEDEGDTQVGSAGPYPVSFRALVPSLSQATNLFVPWCLSASHIGFDSIRMEPVFMILGQAAGTAAALMVNDGVAAQQLSLAELQAQLQANGQLLQWGATGSGIIVDDTNATGVTITGSWTSSTAISGYYGTNYLTDGNANKGLSSVTFAPTLPASGPYQVYARWTASSNRATNTPMDVISPSGTNTFLVDQTQQGGAWVLLLTTNFNAGTNGKVRIRNTGTTEYVIANAVEFVSLSNLPVVSVWATDARPSRYGPHAGSFTVGRAGLTNAALTINLALGGTAVNGSDYQRLATTITLAAGMAFTNISIVPITNSLPVGNETITVSLATNAAYAIGSLATANLTLLDAPFFQWQVQEFGANATNSAIAGAAAEPAGDHIPNLLKYALGLNPAVAVNGPLFTPTIDTNGNFTVTYTRPDPPPLDVNYQWFFSTNLLTWSASNSSNVAQQILLQSNCCTAAITAGGLTAAGSTTAGFVRLQVGRQ